MASSIVAVLRYMFAISVVATSDDTIRLDEDEHTENGNDPATIGYS